jgi:hypothetical protein
MDEVLICGRSRVRARADQGEATEQAACAAENRLGGQRGQFVAQVGLEEGAESDAVVVESVEELREGALIPDFADDDVRVFLLDREERTGRLSDGVTGLDNLLGRREVLADQNVHIRDLRHRSPPRFE